MSESLLHAGAGRRRGALARFSLWPVLGLLLTLVLVAGCAPAGSGPLPGWGGAAIAGDLVFTATSENELIAFGTDGAEKWRFGGDQPLRGIFGPPAVEEGMVYLGAYNGVLYAIRAEDGTVLWQAPSRPNAEAPIIGSPAVAGNLVVVSTGQGVSAYDRVTGAPAWSFPIQQKAWSTPAVSGDRVYVGGMDHKLYAISLGNGVKAWEYLTGGAIPGRPLVFGDAVFVGSFDGKLHAVEAATGNRRWMYDAGAWFWGGPVTDGKWVYAAALDGVVYAFDPSGNKQWDHAMSGSVVSQPGVTSAGLLVASDDGRLSLLSFDNGLEQWPYDAKGRVRGPIVATQKAAYVATRNPSQVHSLDPAQRKVQWIRQTEKTKKK